MRGSLTSPLSQALRVLTVSCRDLSPRIDVPSSNKMAHRNDLFKRAEGVDLDSKDSNGFEKAGGTLEIGTNASNNDTPFRGPERPRDVLRIDMARTWHSWPRNSLHHLIKQFARRPRIIETFTASRRAPRALLEPFQRPHSPG